jgi:hypothetical protein
MWKIYYADDTTVSSKDYIPYTIPIRSGIQVIVQEDAEDRWVTVSGTDYYVWKGDEWFGVDIFGLQDYLLSPGSKCVLFGTIISKYRFREIYNRARTDMMFLQPKVIHEKKERQP